MRNEVDLAPDGATLRIRFGYRPDLVALVKELPDRRFDGMTKTWSVPARHAEAVYTKLARHLFDFAPDVMSMVAGTMSKPSGAKAAATPGASPRSELPFAGDDESSAATTTSVPDSISVSQLNEKIKDALLGNFAQRIWVTGEVFDFDKNANKPHKYFALVEKGEGASKQKARIDAVMWGDKANEVFRKLAQQAPDFAMRDGIEIRALVKVDFYVPTGRVSVHVEDIDPAFTLGKLALNREQILRTLREQGLADANKSLPLPIPPLRIGVLTSPDADGWNDFKKHLESSGVGFAVTIVPVKVQGAEVRATVLAGLRWFAERAADFDCVCILRGGGSRTDLAWFDDMDIALAVARLPLKALIGIGHERDRSVLDEIAHSEKTPTAVAAFLVDTVLGLRRKVAERAVQLQRSVGRLLQREAQWLARSTVSLESGVNARLRGERQRLATATRDLARGSLLALANGKSALAAAADKLRTSALKSCERERQALLRASDRGRHAAQRVVERAGDRLERLSLRLRLLDPRKVVARGYALVRDDKGRVLPSASRVEAGQNLVLQMRDGAVRVRAESIEPQS